MKNTLLATLLAASSTAQGLDTLDGFDRYATTPPAEIVLLMQAESITDQHLEDADVWGVFTLDEEEACNRVSHQLNIEAQHNGLDDHFYCEL